MRGMELYDWSTVPREQMNPSFARQVIHAENLTVARVYLSKGCLVPEHQHVNEQVCMMLEGRIRFVVAGEEVMLMPGQSLRIPPNVPHWVEALEDSIATDLFSPSREDWKRGDDAYLRGR
jgi:quercetin dioxygenase-like cupin family protein